MPNLKCGAYKLLEWSRRTWMRPFYKGSIQFGMKGATSVGVVVYAPDDAEDGDVTFGINRLEDDGKGVFRHCEVTPCTPDALKAIVRTFKVGNVVVVKGDERFDPPHLGGSNAGWWEHHPVTGAAKLAENINEYRQRNR